MKKRNLPIAALLIGCTTLVGCKSASQFAFWKSKDATETTALADSEPELPSDMAKRTEIASTGGTSAGGGQAAPFVPAQLAETTAPDLDAAGFPSTGVAAYSPENAIAALSGAGGSGSAKQSDAESGASRSALPYDPSAVPGGSPAATTTSVAGNAAATNHYGGATPSNNFGNAPAYGQTAAADNSALAAANAGIVDNNSLPPTISSLGLPGTDRYGSASAATSAGATNAASLYPTTSVAESTPTATGGMASVPAAVDRYGAPAGGAASSQAAATTGSYGSGSAAMEMEQTTPTAVVAAAYRPGGTTSYPTSGAVEVAARPQAGTSPNVGQIVPNVNSPTTDIGGATQYR